MSRDDFFNLGGKVMMQPGSFGFIGLQIVEDFHMTSERRETVKRTWRERLWSWPWRPWQATRTSITRVPSDMVYRVGNTLVMHPVTANRLRSELSAQDMQPSRRSEG